MWKEGDYQVFFEHKDVFFTNDELRRAVDRTVEGGFIDEMTERAVEDVEFMTTAIIKKRLRDGDLKAWATVSIGHAFCQCDDTFSKRMGRQIAFARAKGAMRGDVKEINAIYERCVVKPVREKAQRDIRVLQRKIEMQEKYGNKGGN